VRVRRRERGRRGRGEVAQQLSFGVRPRRRERRQATSRSASAPAPSRSGVEPSADGRRAPGAGPPCLSKSSRSRREKPRVSVRGIEEVERLPHEVGPPARVEAAAFFAAENTEPLDRVALQSRVQRLRRRWKEVRALGAHLRGIDVHLRRRPGVSARSALASPPASPRPSPDEIETESGWSDPSATPDGARARRGSRSRLARHRGSRARRGICIRPSGFTMGSIVRTNGRRSSVVSRSREAARVIERRHRGVGARRLVAVNSIGEPDENREIVGHRRRFPGDRRIEQRIVPGQLVETGEICRGAVTTTRRRSRPSAVFP